MKSQVANIITACRIVCSILLLFFPVFSLEFYAVYLICGFSDMTDGLVARKTLISEHSILNKVTGFVLFLLPLTIHIVELKYSFSTTCLIATFAAIQEGYYIRTRREII